MILPDPVAFVEINNCNCQSSLPRWCRVSEISIHSRQWILGGGKARGASARAPEHIPKWICEERATTPPPKSQSALRVALKLASGFVAQSAEYRCGYTPSLAPRPSRI